MKKSGVFVLFTLIILNMLISFGDETIQSIELGENQIVALSNEWVYVENFWVKSEAFENMSDLESVSLDDIMKNDKRGQSNNVVRGTLLKTFIIPKTFVGKPMVIDNALFDDHFELYINDEYCEKSTVLSNYSKIENAYLFIPRHTQITVLIHFEQDLSRGSHKSNLSLGSMEGYNREQQFTWQFESFVLALTVIFFVYLIWQRQSGRIKNKGITLELIVVSFFINFLISGFGKSAILYGFELVRVQFFLFVYISTTFATYGYKCDDRWIAISREISRVYLILFTVGIIILPLDYLKYIWIIQLVATLIYVIACNQYKRQWQINFMYAYFWGLALLRWNGSISSYIVMVPIIVILIYKSFFRIMEGEQNLKDEALMSIKASYGDDKLDMKFKEISDSVEEGLAVVTEDLYIDHAYSEAMQYFFDIDIKHRKVTELLYPNDFDSKDYAEAIIGRYFESDAETDRKLYLDLLADEVIINDRILKLEYKMAKTPKYLIVRLTDQTELQAQIAEKEALQKTLDRTLEIINNETEFKKIYQEFKQFNNQIFECNRLETTSVNPYIEDLLLKFEYFEKHFFRFRLLTVTEVLQQIIHKLMNFKKERGSSTLGELKKYLEAFNIEKMISEELNMFKNVIDLEAVKSEKTLLVEHYNLYVSELARKYGKKVNLIVIEGYEPIVSNEKYKGILKRLTHLMDNAIIHGIETPSERFRKNKSEYGTITVKFEKKASYVEIILEDDGIGLDYSGIKEMLYQKKKISFETLNHSKSEDFLEFLFESGVTTDEKNHLGSGLTEVRNEVNRLHGSIKIESEFNLYTRVVIRIECI